MSVNIVNMLQLSFMQNALIVAIFLGILLPIIGLLIYMKRLVFLADTIGQISMAGVSFSVFIAPIIAQYFAINNNFIVIIMTVLAAIIIQFLMDRIKNYQDAGLIIVHAIAICMMMIFLSLSNDYQANLFTLLFGNINGVNNNDVLLIGFLSVIILLILAKTWKTNLMIIIDGENAKLVGINVTFYKYLLIILLSITISISIKVIGVLLVTTLLALPIISANNIAYNLKNTILYSIMFCLLSFIIGIICSYYIDLPTSSLIVLVGIVIYFGTIFIKHLKK